MDFFISRLGSTTALLPETVLRSFEFRYGNAHRVYDPLGRLKYEKYSTIEVKVVDFLNEGEVLYREWMTDGAPSGMDYHFRIASVSDVVETIRANKATGPIDELESMIPLVPSKTRKENRPKPYLEQSRFRTSAGDIHYIADERIRKMLRFTESGGWNIAGFVEEGPVYESIDMSTIVLVVSGLPDGKVLYRTPVDSVGNFIDVFEIRSISEVIEALEISGASGPIDELKALLPSKLPNRPPSYSSYDPNHAVSTDGKPLDQGDLEKGEPENGGSPTGPIRPNSRSKPGRKPTGPAKSRGLDGVWLARAYVEWVEKLPEEELFRYFRHGRRGERPGKALRAFLSDRFQDPQERLHKDTASMKIGKGLTKCPELRSRLNLKIDHARTAE